MSLKQLLIILILLGTQSSIDTLICAVIILAVTFFNVILKRFWDNEKEVIFGVLFTGFLSSLVYRLIQNVDYDWALSKRMFFYSLIVIPVVLLEYRKSRFKVAIKELMFFLNVFVFIGFFKELIIKGTIFNISLFEDYEGLVILNNNSGTLIFISLAIILNNYFRKRGKKWIL